MKNSLMRRMTMSKKIPSRSQVLFALKKIEKEVIRVLGKQQENIITITDVDVFRDYIYPIIGASLGLVLSYVFIGALWFSLYFTCKGVAFISRLNNERLIFSMRLLRLFPILFWVFLMVLWTIYSVFF